ncbi:MAG: LD-carboxypeptidase [Parvularculaceae bacterium]|jgi:muramoyltetrapeptide carboxypeptidase|nr:LD-carboxypeptidase [Parvularculaceae bacterium]
MTKARRKATRNIAIVAPACALKPDAAARVAALAEANFSDAGAALHFHPQCFLSEGHFAGSDEARSAAFLEVANDPAFDAVWFARGGYGSARLDDAIYARLNAAARRKVYMGYSDLGFVLGRLYADGIGTPVHGPMPADINRAGGETAIARALRYLVQGDQADVEPAARGGAKVAAFNLTILVHLIASGRAPNFSAHIVMIEEVSEHHYRIDRALAAVMSSPNMRDAAGLMLGRCSDIPENDPPFLKTEEEIARRWCARAGVPYLGRADIGHDVENKIVPFGAPALVA